MEDVIWSRNYPEKNSLMEIFQNAQIKLPEDFKSVYRDKNGSGYIREKADNNADCTQKRVENKGHKNLFHPTFNIVGS